MITAIHIENFKGIRERVKIDIKPITLLFGPNSAGKSTIVQAIHYAREVLERGNLNADRTLMGGAGMDLGGFRNFVHSRDLTRPVVIRIEMSTDGRILPLFPNDMLHYDLMANKVNERYRQIGEDSWIDVLDDAKSVYVEIEVGWSFEFERPIFRRYETGINGVSFAQITASEDGARPRISFINFRHPDLGLLDKEVINDYNPLWIIMQRSLSQTPSGTYETITKQDPSQVQLLFEIKYQKTVLPDFGTMLSLEDDALSNLIGFELRMDYVEQIEAFLSRAILGPGEILLKELVLFRYVGPVRDVPPRHYEPTLTYDESKWACGLAAWDRLAQNEKVLAAASAWLSREDRLDTGYEISVKKFREIDTAEPLALELMDWDEGPGHVEDLRQAFLSYPLKRRVELRKLPEYLPLQPYDVGTGLAKMIPVLVAALDERKGIVAIEEPESNIHPRWQVVLGDLFIERALRYSQTFLLETHSEHVLLRLLRRIRETTAGEVDHNFEVKPEDVSVIYVDNAGQRSVLHNLRIDSDGEFIDRWPDGFFDERGGELF